MGLLQFDLEVRGIKEKCFAFFTLKTVVMDQRSFGDITNLVSVAAGEELMFNAALMSENSKVPYVATAVWRARDGRPRRPGLDLTSLTDQQKDEWRKNTEAIVKKWTEVNKVKYEREKAKDDEETMRRATEALARAGGEERPPAPIVPAGPVRWDSTPQEQDKEAAGKEDDDKEEEPHEWKWETSLVEWSGSVEKVINNNFALGVSYQQRGWEERRFFVMFDTTDVWVEGEVAQKKGKGMKEIANRGDGIKFNAVMAEGKENSWNLMYIATAVIINKNQELLRAQDMPTKSIRKTSCSELNPAQLKTFEQVAGKLTQKPAPEDPNVQARREQQRQRMADQDRILQERKKRCGALFIITPLLRIMIIQQHHDHQQTS
jgi:hypothetical protein